MVHSVGTISSSSSIPFLEKWLWYLDEPEPVYWLHVFVKFTKQRWALPVQNLCSKAQKTELVHLKLLNHFKTHGHWSTQIETPSWTLPLSLNVPLSMSLPDASLTTARRWFLCQNFSVLYHALGFFFFPPSSCSSVVNFWRFCMFVSNHMTVFIK